MPDVDLSTLQPVDLTSLTPVDTAPSKGFDKEIAAASKKYNVPESWIRATIAQESSGNPKALGPETKSGKAYGLMQLLPSTAASYGYKGTPEGLFDAATNIDLGTRYISDLRKKHKNDNQAVFSEYYSGGPDNYKTNPDVKKYVDSVAAKMGTDLSTLQAFEAPTAKAPKEVSDLGTKEIGRDAGQMLIEGMRNVGEGAKSTLEFPKHATPEQIAISQLGGDYSNIVNPLLQMGKTGLMTLGGAVDYLTSLAGRPTHFAPPPQDPAWEEAQRFAGQNAAMTVEGEVGGRVVSKVPVPKIPESFAEVPKTLGDFAQKVKEPVRSVATLKPSAETMKTAAKGAGKIGAASVAAGIESQVPGVGIPLAFATEAWGLKGGIPDLIEAVRKYKGDVVANRLKLALDRATKAQAIMDEKVRTMKLTPYVSPDVSGAVEGLVPEIEKAPKPVYAEDLPKEYPTAQQPDVSKTIEGLVPEVEKAPKPVEMPAEKDLVRTEQPNVGAAIEGLVPEVEKVPKPVYAEDLPKEYPTAQQPNVGAAIEGLVPEVEKAPKLIREEDLPKEYPPTQQPNVGAAIEGLVPEVEKAPKPVRVEDLPKEYPPTKQPKVSRAIEGLVPEVEKAPKPVRVEDLPKEYPTAQQPDVSQTVSELLPRAGEVPKVETPAPAGQQPYTYPNLGGIVGDLFPTVPLGEATKALSFAAEKPNIAGQFLTPGGQMRELPSTATPDTRLFPAPKTLGEALAQTTGKPAAESPEGATPKDVTAEPSKGKGRKSKKKPKTIAERITQARAERLKKS